MSTLAAMVAEIATEINRTDLNTQITLAINRAILYYSRDQRFWFNETTGTFVTVANQQSYGTADGTPTDILDIDLVRIAVASTDNPVLQKRTYQQIQTWNLSNIAGEPAYYAYYQNKFWLYPLPAQVYTITVSYAKSYATLSGSQNNDFTDNAEDLIEARAMWWVYKRLLRNYAAAADMKQEELDALEALQSQTTRLVKSGRLVATDF